MHLTANSAHSCRSYVKVKKKNFFFFGWQRLGTVFSASLSGKAGKNIIKSSRCRKKWKTNHDEFTQKKQNLMIMFKLQECRSAPPIRHGVVVV